MSHNYSLHDLTAASGDGTGHESAINGDRRGLHGMWEASSPNSQPVSLGIHLNRPLSVGRIRVYTAQDDLEHPVEPDENTSGAVNGVEDFNVEALLEDGTWQTVGRGIENEAALVEMSFEPVLTDLIKVNVTKHRGGKARIVEVEAYPR